jgi:hypothetical protein
MAREDFLGPRGATGRHRRGRMKDVELLAEVMLGVGIGLIAWWAADRARLNGVPIGLPGSARPGPTARVQRHRHRPPVARAAPGFPRVRRLRISGRPVPAGVGRAHGPHADRRSDSPRPSGCASTRAWRCPDPFPARYRLSAALLPSPAWRGPHHGTGGRALPMPSACPVRENRQRPKRSGRLRPPPASPPHGNGTCHAAATLQPRHR